MIRIPQIGEFVVCYEMSPGKYGKDELVFKALIIGKEGEEYITSVLYCDKVHRYRPLDNWIMSWGDWKSIHGESSGRRWVIEGIEDGT